MYYIVAYDSPSNKRRQKLMNLLKDFLNHVQKSVFEGPLSNQKFNELMKLVHKTIDPDSDSVRIYQMPKSCWTLTKVIGFPPLSENPPVILVTDSQNFTKQEG